MSLVFQCFRSTEPLFCKTATVRSISFYPNSSCNVLVTRNIFLLSGSLMKSYFSTNFSASLSIGSTITANEPISWAISKHLFSASISSIFPNPWPWYFLSMANLPSKVVGITLYDFGSFFWICNNLEYLFHFRIAQNKQITFFWYRFFV